MKFVQGYFLHFTLIKMQSLIAFAMVNKLDFHVEFVNGKQRFIATFEPEYSKEPSKAGVSDHNEKLQSPLDSAMLPIHTCMNTCLSSALSNKVTEELAENGDVPFVKRSPEEEKLLREKLDAELDMVTQKYQSIKVKKYEFRAYRDRVEVHKYGNLHCKDGVSATFYTYESMTIHTTTIGLYQVTYGIRHGDPVIETRFRGNLDSIHGQPAIIYGGICKWYDQGKYMRSKLFD